MDRLPVTQVAAKKHRCPGCTGDECVSVGCGCTSEKCRKGQGPRRYTRAELAGALRQSYSKLSDAYGPASREARADKSPAALRELATSHREARQTLIDFARDESPRIVRYALAEHGKGRPIKYAQAAAELGIDLDPPKPAELDDDLAATADEDEQDDALSREELAEVVTLARDRDWSWDRAVREWRRTRYAGART